MAKRFGGILVLSTLVRVGSYFLQRVRMGRLGRYFQWKASYGFMLVSGRVMYVGQVLITAPQCVHSQLRTT